MNEAFDALYEKGKDTDPDVHSVHTALAVARKSLEDTAGNNIHREGDMIAAAAELHFALRQLVIALDAERGERP